MDSLPATIADLTPSAATLSPDEVLATRASSLRRLATLLRLAAGAWALAVYESGDVQRQMVDELRQAIAPLPLVEVSLLKETPDPLRIVRGIEPDGEAPVVSFHSVGRQVADLAGYLDLQRDVLAGFPHRLLFWVNPRDRAELARRAPNFFSRLSGVFYFPGAPATSDHGVSRPASLARAIEPASTASAVRRRPFLPVGDQRQRAQQIDFLHRRIRALRELPRPDSAAIGDAWYDLAGAFEQALPPRWLEGEAAYLEAARAYAAAGMTLAEAEARYQAGQAALRGYDYPGANNHLAAALTTFRLLTDSPRATPDAVAGEANVLTAQGSVFQALAQWQEARANYEEALGLYRSLSDLTGEAMMLNNIGGVYSALGEKQQALAYLEQALPLSRQVGDRAGEATTLNNMAGIYFSQGDYARSAGMLSNVLEIARQLGAVAEEALLCFNLAFVLHHHLGDTDRAVALVRRSIDILRRYGLPQDVAGQTLAQHEAFLAEMLGGGGTH